MKSAAALTVALVLMFTSTTSFSKINFSHVCPETCSCEKHPPSPRLVLTSEQKAELKLKQKEKEEALVSNRVAQYEVNENIHHLMTAGTVDEIELNKLSKMGAKLIDEETKLQMKMDMEAYSMLSGPQKANYATLYQLWKNRHAPVKKP